MRAAMRLTLFTTLCVLAAHVNAQAGDWVGGEAVYTGVPYGANASAVALPAALPDGACGYGPMLSSMYPGFSLVGIGNSSSLASTPMSGCGQCLEVKCNAGEYCLTDKPIQVLVYDACDECTGDQLNLYYAPFSKLAPLQLGRMKIQYRQVPCKVAGNIVVNVDTYRATAGGYIKLSLKNVAGSGGITSVQLAQTGSTAYRPMNNTYGAEWEISIVPAPPLDIKVTNQQGQSVVLRGIITKAGQTGAFKSAVQFAT